MKFSIKDFFSKCNQIRSFHFLCSDTWISVGSIFSDCAVTSQKKVVSLHAASFETIS